MGPVEGYGQCSPHTANANVSPRPGDRFVWAKHLVTMVQTGTDSAQSGTLCVGLLGVAGFKGRARV